MKTFLQFIEANVVNFKDDPEAKNVVLENLRKRILNLAREAYVLLEEGRQHYLEKNKKYQNNVRDYFLKAFAMIKDLKAKLIDFWQKYQDKLEPLNKDGMIYRIMYKLGEENTKQQIIVIIDDTLKKIPLLIRGENNSDVDIHGVVTNFKMFVFGALTNYSNEWRRASS